MGTGNNPQGYTLTVLILSYIPNKTAAGVAGILFLITSVLLFWRVFRHKNKWALVLPIGALAHAFGYFVRVLLTSSTARQNSKGIYAAQQVLIVCSPAAYLAFTYIVYGRLVTYCLGNRHALIKPTRVAPVFILSDVSTFLIQAVGAAMTIGETLRKTGSNVYLVGLIIQLLSYSIYSFMVLKSIHSVKKEGIATGHEAWWKIIRPLVAASTLILARCIYRIVERAQGTGGFLLTHEVFFYCLDTLPLFIAINIFVFYWPGKYFDQGDSIVDRTHVEKSTTNRI